MTDGTPFPDPERGLPPSAWDRIVAIEDFYQGGTQGQIQARILENVKRADDVLDPIVHLGAAFGDHGVRLHEIRPAEAAQAIAETWDVAAFEAAICFIATSRTISRKPTTSNIDEVVNAMDRLGAILYVIERDYCREDDVIDASVLPWFASLLPTLSEDLEMSIEMAHDSYALYLREQEQDAQQFMSDE